MPDLETPGARESVCATPRKMALPNVRSRSDLVRGLPVDRVEDEGADGEEDRDLPGLAEVPLDRAAERRADDHCRNRGDYHDPRDPFVRVANRPLHARFATKPSQARELCPEVRDYCHERSEVQRDVERAVEAFVLFEVRPVEQPGHEDQVPRRRDGQELREALDGAQNERLPVGERTGAARRRRGCRAELPRPERRRPRR